MTKIMIVGDTHGGEGVIERKSLIAKGHGIQKMFVMGDFGLWGGQGGVVFLDVVNHIAAENQLSIFAIPGNHEDHNQWKAWLKMPDLPTWHGFVSVRSRVWLSPKFRVFSFAGKRFAICGGAVSIDKNWRTPGKSWWPDEEFSQEVLDSVLKYGGPDIDYLFSHDASNHTEWGFRLKPDMESQANRERLDQAIAHLKPGMHFHGHMHEKYEWVNTASHGQRNSAFGYDDTNWNGASTMTYGLECDNEDYSWGILDVEKGKFTWGPDVS